MAACKKNKQVKQSTQISRKKLAVIETQSTKTPKFNTDSDAFYEKYPVWAFSKSDFEHQKWGLQVNDCRLLDIIKKLKSYETMKWGDILGDIAGRKSHPKNSEKNVSQIIKEAQERFCELNLYYEHDTVYSLTIDGGTRLWGIRTGNIFYVIWIDPKHEIYPVEKSHT